MQHRSWFSGRHSTLETSPPAGMSHVCHRQYSKHDFRHAHTHIHKTLWIIHPLSIISSTASRAGRSWYISASPTSPTANYSCSVILLYLSNSALHIQAEPGHLLWRHLRHLKQHLSRTHYLLNTAKQTQTKPSRLPCPKLSC